MGKTELLKIELKKTLKGKADRVSYETGPKNKAYPYLVFETSELSSSDGKTVYQLEVNIFDSGNETGTIDELADTIQTALHNKFFIDGLIQFVIYKGPRQSPKEDNKDILRRRLLFEVQLHELKGENQ